MSSSMANIRTFILGYQTQDITLELDSTTGRWFLSKVLGNSLYTNELDMFAYIVNVNSLYTNSSIGLYQKNKMFIVDNKLEYSNYVFKNTDFIYIFKDVATYTTLSEFDSKIYTLNIDDNLNDPNIEILEVFFNGEKVNSFNFNPTTNELTLNEFVFYNHLNEISIIVGNKDVDPTKMKILGDYMLHRKKSEDIEFIQDNYIEISNKLQDISVSRGFYDNFVTKRRLDNLAIHNESTNIRSELNLKFIKQLSFPSSSFGGGLYGSGTFGATISGVEDLLSIRRFRIILYDEVIQDILVYNNCKVRLDFSYEFSTINLINLVVDANKELKFNYLYLEDEGNGCS